MPLRTDGDWPVDIFLQEKSRFKDKLGAHYETDIQPMQAKIAAHKHPWNILRTASIIGGAAGTITAANLWEQGVMPVLAAAGFGFIGTHSMARKKNRGLNAAKKDLSHYMEDAIGLDIFDVLRSHSSVLRDFRALGFIGPYEDVHYFAGLAPKSTVQITPQSPQSIGTKLTRTVTETYTDSQGRTRTRRRTVKVFEGLLLSLNIEDFPSDNRILITSRRTHRFSGPFARIRNGKRHKMDKVKTSSPDFNRFYKVRTDDSTLAHLFLDPERVMRLNNLYADLQQALGMKRVAISMLITKGQLWVAVETRGLPNTHDISGDDNAFDQEVGQIIGQAALPHMIAQHLELPRPMPFAWQDPIMETR